MATEPKTGLTFYPAGALQPDLIVNAMMYWMAVWAQAVVLEITDTPPGSESEGDMYLAAASSTGAWAGHDHQVVYCVAADTYLFFPPGDGYLLRNLDNDTSYRFDGLVWNPESGGGGGGGASVGVQYLADTGSTADSDPGAGLLKWNNATQASATFLYLDDSTDDGVTLTAWWAALDAGGFCYLQHATDQDTWQIWEITSVVDAAGYVKLGVTLLANGGSFADDDPMLVTLEQGSTTSAATWGTITGTLSSQTDLQTALNAASPVGLHSVPIMAGSIQPSVTGGCSIVTSVASAANQPDIVTVDFDATTQEYAQFCIPMPKSWNEGTITADFRWSHAATTTNFGVVWSIQAVAVSNDDPIAVNFGTAQQIADTGGTTNDLYITSHTPAMTVGGTPAAEDTVFFRVSRVTGDGSDTMAIDARLHSVVIYMTTDASNDA